jgi:tRNA pseudouridine55 synthase
MKIDIGSTEAGFVVINKAPNMTSHDVVDSVRRIFVQRKVGHAGTLDPSATGVLIVALGRATRTLRLFNLLPKTYQCTILLGTSTDTLDDTGNITDTYDMDLVTDVEIEKAVLKLTGEIDQIPPMVSAVKVAGKKLYEYQRESKEVDRPVRKVNIYKFDVLDRVKNELKVEIKCSTGTYVRALAQALGEYLGGGAYAKDIVRTAIGEFTIDVAIELDSLVLGDILSIKEGLAFLTQIEVNDNLEPKIINGSPVSRVELNAAGPGPFVVYSPNYNWIAIYETLGLDRLKPSLVIK